MNKDHVLHFFFALFLITGATTKYSLAYADGTLTNRPQVKHFIHDMVKKHGFDRRELVDVLNHVVIQPKIIASMNAPYEKKPWDTYKQIFIKPERVQEGLQYWRQNQRSLQLAEKKYGVPAHIIVAILGVETRYGLRQGEYRVLDALATLAFDYPQRAPFFTKELAEFLLLCREHHVSPYAYLGSYAGAMGKPQFMPSSYRYYADDFTGQPKKDLMHDDAAAIASVANYFHRHGWQNNDAIVQPAKVLGQGYLDFDVKSKNAAYSLASFTKAGIQPIPPMPSHLPPKAGLIQLDTTKGFHEYWIAYPNFYVITRYNASPQYALVVFLFSEQLKQQWAKLNHAPIHAYG